MGIISSCFQLSVFPGCLIDNFAVKLSPLLGVLFFGCRGELVGLGFLIEGTAEVHSLYLS